MPHPLPPPLPPAPLLDDDELLLLAPPSPPAPPLDDDELLPASPVLDVVVPVLPPLPPAPEEVVVPPPAPVDVASSELHAVIASAAPSERTAQEEKNLSARWSFMTG
jgi:hypothetical protein